MGSSQSNPCRALGFEGKPIGTAQLQELWNKYDKNHNGILEADEVEKFCLDLGQAINHPISVSEAKALYDAHNTGTGLTKDQFFSLFVAVAQEADQSDPSASRLNMTESLLSHGSDEVPSPSPALITPILYSPPTEGVVCAL